MTSSQTMTTTPESATWDPPCVTCSAPIGMQVPDGKYVGVTQCEKCRGETDLVRLRAAGVPELFIAQKASLDSFHRGADKSLDVAVKRCKEILEPKTLMDRTWLVLSGNEGSGKSHLAAAVAMEFLGAGRTARFITFDELLVEILATYKDESGESAKSVIERFTKGAYFLGLDDVGVEQPTAHVIQVLYRILNARLNDKRPTILTTNYPLTKQRDTQPTLGERLAGGLSDDTPIRRILSRIAGEAHYVHITAGDYRRRSRSK